LLIALSSARGDDGGDEFVVDGVDEDDDEPHALSRTPRARRITKVGIRRTARSYANAQG
jgi:hypothetical protein